MDLISVLLFRFYQLNYIHLIQKWINNFLIRLIMDKLY